MSDNMFFLSDPHPPMSVVSGDPDLLTALSAYFLTNHLASWGDTEDAYPLVLLILSMKGLGVVGNSKQPLISLLIFVI